MSFMRKWYIRFRRRQARDRVLALGPKINEAHAALADAKWHHPDEVERMIAHLDSLNRRRDKHLDYLKTTPPY